VESVVSVILEDLEIIAKRAVEIVQGDVQETSDYVLHAILDSLVKNANSLALKTVAEVATKQQENVKHAKTVHTENSVNLVVLTHAQVVSVISKQVNVNTAQERNSEKTANKTALTVPILHTEVAISNQVNAYHAQRVLSDSHVKDYAQETVEIHYVK
jgi:hypothetical protein